MVDAITNKRLSKKVALREDPTCRKRDESDVLEYIDTGETITIIDDYLFYGYNDKPYIFVEHKGKRGYMLNEALEVIT